MVSGGRRARPSCPCVKGFSGSFKLTWSFGVTEITFAINSCGHLRTSRVDPFRPFTLAVSLFDSPTSCLQSFPTNYSYPDSGLVNFEDQMTLPESFLLVCISQSSNSIQSWWPGKTCWGYCYLVDSRCPYREMSRLFCHRCWLWFCLYPEISLCTDSTACN